MTGSIYMGMTSTGKYNFIKISPNKFYRQQISFRYDRQGYNRRGFHKDTGFNRTGYNPLGEYDQLRGFSKTGYDHNGRDRAGMLPRAL